MGKVDLSTKCEWSFEDQLELAGQRLASSFEPRETAAAGRKPLRGRSARVRGGLNENAVGRCGGCI